MDLVQYKLQRLDERNAGLQGLLSSGLETMPLAFCAIGLIAGIAAQRYAIAELRVWIGLLVTTVAIGIPACLLSKPPRRPATTALITTLAFVCLGGIRLISATHVDHRDISSLISQDSSIADLRGRITGNIHIEDRSGWQFGPLLRKDLASGFDLDVSQARCLTGWERVTGKVRVSVGEPIYDLKPGDNVQVYATLSRFRETMNPGGFDSRSFYQGQGISAAVFVETRAAIEPWLTSGPRQNAFACFQQWLRDTADRKLKWGRWGHDESDGLLEALLLGTRSDITPQTYEAFRRTGLLHYVSLSGMHIGIVIGAVWQLARIAGITRRRRAALCIAAIVLFLVLVPAQSPILRAGVIGLVFCTAALARREPQPVNTLALAAVLILLWAPLELFSIGWQLSFGCVLGILLFSMHFEFLFYRAVARLMRRNLSPEDLRRGIGSRSLRASVALMATGLAAWLGGGGLMLYHFYNITPLASLWTAVTSPLMAMIMVLGYIKIVLSAILPTLGSALAPLVAFLSWAFIGSVTLMAKVGVSEIVVGHVPLWLVVLYYVTIFYIPLIHWPSPRPRKALACALLAVFAGSLGLLKWQRSYPADVEFTCLSVGHGQAAVARLPGGNFLFDCGSRSLKDCGRKVVMPLLRWQGASGLDAAFLSHGDTDHCNGIPEIMTACEPKKVFVSAPLEAELADYGPDAILGRAIGTACRGLIAGERLSCGKAKIMTLWPVSGTEAVRLTDNDKSLVTLIEFADRRILICSDIQQYAQKRILSLYPGLKADVVLAPHHGSTGSRYKGFIDALQPQAVIYSCDSVQRDRVLLAKPDMPGIETYFTCYDGAVTVHIDEHGSMNISTFTQAHKKGTPGARP
jgi:competence protein ComEC